MLCFEDQEIEKISRSWFLTVCFAVVYRPYGVSDTKHFAAFMFFAYFNRTIYFYECSNRDSLVIYVIPCIKKSYSNAWHYADHHAIVIMKMMMIKIIMTLVLFAKSSVISGHCALCKVSSNSKEINLKKNMRIPK